MKCNCCDKELTEKEIQWNEDLGTWELCTFCLDVALEAAYGNGYNSEDDEFIILDDWDGDDTILNYQMDFDFSPNHTEGYE